ncbi:MAG: hypothetical protein A3I66_22730 [Burkholderiales bacterium RIFCSPLOWO2_02_FULL_57_36]|nr:MAG: hypothetical protein A3I66_22730 [Burkholderiales bacterium RIFCSPLOWO2_02_FULL_57_36]
MTPIENDAFASNTNAMSKKLLEQLPLIIANGRQEADHVLEIRHLLALETREWALPAKDSAILKWIKADKRRRQMNALTDVQPNRLIHGDDLLVMAALLAGDAAMPSLQGKLDLIYMDMPFCCEEVFQIRSALAEPQVIGQFAHMNQREYGTATYLAMLVPRLLLMRELLSARGLIFMRVGAHVKYFVKMIIDDVFGRQNSCDHMIFEGAVGRSPDVNGKSGNFRYAVLLFGKGEAARIGGEILQASYGKSTEFCHHQSNSPGSSRDPNFDQIFPIQSMLETPGQKISINEREKFPDDIADINADHACCACPGTDITSPQGDENIDDATQETALLLEAIISASTRLESIVADFSGRSGNTAVIAERLGRRWVTSDISKPACVNMRSRLIEQNAEPFLYQAIDGSLGKATNVLPGESFRAGDLSQIVLLLYGALPLPSEDDPGRNLGRMHNAGAKTLVLVEPRDEVIGFATLKKAIAQRDSLMGNWEKIVVLGWKFEPSIGASIAALNDGRLEVATIPANLLDLLKNKGNAGKLHEYVCFADTQA